MSELPSFEEEAEILFDEELEEATTHERNPKLPQGRTEYYCKVCKQDMKTAGGLGAHKKFKHTVDADEALSYDITKILVEMTEPRRAIYSKELDMFILPKGINIPEGYQVYHVGDQPLSVKKDMDDRKGISVYPITIIKTEKTMEGASLNILEEDRHPQEVEVLEA